MNKLPPPLKQQGFDMSHGDMCPDNGDWDPDQPTIITSGNQVKVLNAAGDIISSHTIVAGENQFLTRAKNLAKENLGGEILEMILNAKSLNEIYHIGMSPERTNQEKIQIGHAYQTWAGLFD